MEDGDIPPYWQPPATLTRRHRHLPSSPLLNSSLLIILLPSISLLFIVFIVIPSVPKILPHYNNNNNNSPQYQKSISVKKSWDNLNIILVISAILCGVFAKRKDDSLAANEPDEMHNSEQHTTTRSHAHDHSSSNSSNSSNTVLLQRSKTMMHHQLSSNVPLWFEYSQQQRISSPVNAPPGTGISRLRRTVSSDPYTKYNSNNNTGNTQFRFFDDHDLSNFYPKEELELELELDPQPADVAAEVVDDVESIAVKEIEVDTFVLENRGASPSPMITPPQTPPRNLPAPPPPPPPPPPAKYRRTFQSIPRREENPPPPMKKRSSRKRMNATKEIATAIVYLYSHRKRKRRQKSSRKFEDSPINSQFVIPPSPPPPPPPLPLHPPSVFQNWFKKGSKSKKIHSYSAIPTPPPPLIPNNPMNSARKPPLPTKREAGNECPMNGVPPPPFKVSDMKFTPVGGGFVKLRSAQSSRCGLPEINGNDDPMSSSNEINGQDMDRLSSVTCPSPDLNVKADSFIARHHDGWRLEKLNSWREKLNKGGNGPTSRPSF